MAKIHWMIILDFRYALVRWGEGGWGLLQVLSRSGKRHSDGPDEIELKRQKNVKYTDRESLMCYNSLWKQKRWGDVRTKKQKVIIELSMTVLLASSLIYFTNCEYTWPSNAQPFNPSSLITGFNISFWSLRIFTAFILLGKSKYQNKSMAFPT